MSWLIELMTGDSIAHAVAMLAAVAAVGLFLGSIRIGAVSLGIGGVLFAGIGFGHFGVTINSHVLEFAREFGLILFVYTIGLQVGPGFFASLRKQGLPLNSLAAAIVLGGGLIAVGLHYIGDVATPVAAGLFSGATTNTPSLAAAQEAIRQVHGAEAPEAGIPALAYAVSYPFGIVGIILTMLAIRTFFRINVAGEVSAFEKDQKSDHEGLETINLEVRNPNLEGVALRDLPFFSDSQVVVSRLQHQGVLSVPKPESTLAQGDILHAVGPARQLEQLRVLVGAVSGTNLKELPSELSTQRIVVSHRKHLGKTFRELGFEKTYGVAITRVARGDVEFAASAAVSIQYGDLLTAVGHPDSIARVAEELGNSPKQLTHTHMVPVLLGIFLGVVAGSIPIFVPGIPAPLKLGLAGGPLIVALILSQIGRIGPLVWYMPPSANFILRELGILLFLACVGLKAGHGFVDLVTGPEGPRWMAYGALITIVPLFAAGLFARLVMRMNYVSICGLLAGSMTDPPALAFANQLTRSDSASIPYATVYPLVMLLRVFVAQTLVLLLK